MRWCAPGFEASWERLRAAFRGAPWPAIPAGFELVEAARPMRMVLRGTVLQGPVLRGPVLQRPVLQGTPLGPDGGALAVVVKRNRPVSLTDRLSRVLRGGKGAREGRVLRALGEDCVPVPRVLAYGDAGDDLLVLEEVRDLLPAPDPEHPPEEAVAAVAALLFRAHAAGLVHRDLTRENLAWTSQGPMLMDLGGARLVGELGYRRLVRELARARNALLGDLTRTARRRALRTYTSLRIPTEGFLGALARLGVRRVARDVEVAAARQALRYRLGRDRRATRTGTQYLTFKTTEGVRGVLARTAAPAAWVDQAAGLVRGDPPGATPLKAPPAHGTARIVRAVLPGLDEPVVVKRFGPVAPGRLPRANACFRAAVALQHRFVPTPSPLLAASGRNGAGVLVTAWVEGVDLRRLAEAGGPDLAAALETAGRTLRKMHDAGVSNRDLKAQNLLVSRRAGRERGRGRPEVLVADVEGVRVHRREVRWARRARDLGRLDASLDLEPTLRTRWLTAYHDVLPRPPVPWDAFEARVAARAAWKRARTARRAERAATSQSAGSLSE